MTQSMTAFARAEDTLGNLLIILELRSVNHRYLDIAIRAPEDIRAFEPSLRNALVKNLSRGKVELNIRTHTNQQAKSQTNIQLNSGLIEQVTQSCQKINESLPTELSDTTKINPLDILNWPGVILTEDIDKNELSKQVIQILQQALTDFIEMRQREGDKLETMILERCSEIEKITAQVEQVIPEIIQSKQDKIRERIAAFEIEEDDKRIEQELVLLAQKMDVSEETDRLKAHISEVRNVLAQSIPIGRRLDFLMQELNREANTLGSKSVDIQTTKASVDLKVLIEQMREQVQNIE